MVVAIKPQPPPAWVATQLEAFMALEAIHKSWAAAQAELERTIGRSICVENCGLCCVHNCITGLGIEIDYAASWLATQDKTLRSKVLGRIRQWLDQPSIEVDPSYRGPGAKKPRLGPLGALTKEQYTALAPELMACLHSPCPLMGEDYRCLIHEVRPLGCRAYGVTRLPGPECKRPSGLGETEESRAIIEGPLSLEIQSQVEHLFGIITGDAHLTMWSFLATGLYRRFRPRDLERMAPRIPTVKLIQGAVSGALLFQYQDDSHALTGSFQAFSSFGRVKLEVF